MEGTFPQVLQFIEKIPVTQAPGHLQTLSDGTTNEEVLKVLINRIEFLQEKTGCRENAIVITKLEEALIWLNKRTAARVADQVEGTSRFIPEPKPRPVMQSLPPAPITKEQAGIMEAKANAETTPPEQMVPPVVTTLKGEGTAVEGATSPAV